MNMFPIPEQIVKEDMAGGLDGIALVLLLLGCVKEFFFLFRISTSFVLKCCVQIRELSWSATQHLLNKTRINKAANKIIEIKPEQSYMCMRLYVND